jgi:hypothetical protein
MSANALDATMMATAAVMNLNERADIGVIPR